MPGRVIGGPVSSSSVPRMGAGHGVASLRHPGTLMTRECAAAFSSRCFVGSNLLSPVMAFNKWQYNKSTTEPPVFRAVFSRFAQEQVTSGIFSGFTDG